MLHRRPGPAGPSSPYSSSSPSQSGSNSSRPGIPNINKAYTPLRRQSANLYPNSNNNNGGAAKYTIPQASPLNLGGSTSSYTGGGGLNSPTLDLNDYGYGSNTYGSGGSGNVSLGEDWKSGTYIGKRIREIIEHIGLGLKDALRLERSWDLVWSDRELRTLVLKSTMINLLSLLSLSLGSLIFSPIFVHPISELMENKTKKMGMWYNLLLSWPVFIVCFWINASWGPSISKRAQSILHPSHRFQPSPTSTPTTSSFSSSIPKPAPFAKIFQAITRILLISDFTLISRLIGLLPIFGKWGSLTYMCVIDAYYCFEWNFTSKQWPLDYRISYMQDRTAYMIGFGFPATFLTAFGPPLVNMAIFALIYPFFVLQAIQSKPPASTSSSSVFIPSTPSPQASLPSSPIGGEMSLNDSFFANTSKPPSGLSRNKKFELKLPIFWLASYALQGLKWLEEAASRDRSESRVNYNNYNNNNILNVNGYANNLSNSSYGSPGMNGNGLGLRNVQQLNNSLAERKGKRLQ
ncbi:uncharacterized protein L201_004359 [Kwoniella dendrophila CBS 6074]|uniref:Etoposide-induced protein 2.4-domain-containing protein n=1 Tax=Kwoniella dendrophila CBS 6074 TaxID=1295534 RepID=A0AAX4JXZ3_9TREE